MAELSKRDHLLSRPHHNPGRGGRTSVASREQEMPLLLRRYQHLSSHLFSRVAFVPASLAISQIPPSEAADQASKDPVEGRLAGSRGLRGVWKPQSLETPS